MSPSSLLVLPVCVPSTTQFHPKNPQNLHPLVATIKRKEFHLISLETVTTIKLGAGSTKMKAAQRLYIFTRIILWVF